MMTGAVLRAGARQPAPGADGPSSDQLWWIVLAVCVAAIAISVGGRSLPRWMIL